MTATVIPAEITRGFHRAILTSETERRAMLAEPTKTKPSLAVQVLQKYLTPGAEYRARLAGVFARMSALIDPATGYLSDDVQEVCRTISGLLTPHELARAVLAHPHGSAELVWLYALRTSFLVKFFGRPVSGTLLTEEELARMARSIDRCEHLAIKAMRGVSMFGQVCGIRIVDDTAYAEFQDDACTEANRVLDEAGGLILDRMDAIIREA